MAKRSAAVLFAVCGLIVAVSLELGANASAAAAENREERFQRLRAAMVRTQISHPPDYRDPVRDRRALEAMPIVLRHPFVRSQDLSRAYGDHPLPIGHGQTISQPYIVALMTELLDVHAHHRVLVVGTVILGFRLVMISTCVLYAIAVAAYYLFLRGTPRLSS